jgi:hypothetical protein
MGHKKLWTITICVGLLLGLRTAAVGQQMSSKDVEGVSPQHFKYIVTTLGAAAAGAGLGFIGGGGATSGKLALMAGGGASTWFLHKHRYELGKFHDWGIVASVGALGAGFGWTVCDCNKGIVAGSLIGAGGMAVWEALKHDRAARGLASNDTTIPASNSTTDNKTTYDNKTDSSSQETAKKLQHNASYATQQQ